jgi:hypothetical protein
MLDADKEWNDITDFIDAIKETINEDDLFDAIKEKFPNTLDEIITEAIMIELGGDCIGID